MTLDEFVHLPWQNIAGFVGFLIALTILFSKWIPGAKQMVESTVGWLGELFTAQLASKLDTVIEQLEKHITDPDAHKERHE
jgi:hypothetical protein